jgi:hypothetical protein
MAMPEQRAERATPPPERRTLRAGSVVASFYTSEPEPSQWIAVATIARSDPDNVAGGDVVRLLVGAGDSELTAIEQLTSRLSALDASQTRRLA